MTSSMQQRHAGERLTRGPCACRCLGLHHLPPRVLLLLHRSCPSRPEAWRKSVDLPSTIYLDGKQDNDRRSNCNHLDNRLIFHDVYVYLSWVESALLLNGICCQMACFIWPLCSVITLHTHLWTISIFDWPNILYDFGWFGRWFCKTIWGKLAQQTFQILAVLWSDRYSPKHLHFKSEIPSCKNKKPLYLLVFTCRLSPSQNSIRDAIVIRVNKWLSLFSIAGATACSEMSLCTSGSCLPDGRHSRLLVTKKSLNHTLTYTRTKSL